MTTYPALNVDTIRAIIRAFVIFAADDTDPMPDADVDVETQRIIDVSLIETTPIDAVTEPFTLPAHAFVINFYDDCDVLIIVFIDDDSRVTHAMISADHMPYVPLPL